MRGVRLPFRLLGVPLRLDASFLLILPILGWLIASQIPAYVTLLDQVGVAVDGAALQRGATPALLGLASALGLFACVVLHELGHVLVARAYGHRAEEITLWFLGGMARFRDLPRGRGAEAVVALAGPAVSLALGFLAGSAAWVAGASWLRFLLSYLAIANGGLGLFNLLPALPLDGGRVLRSLLERGTNRLAATRIAVGVSRAVAIALGLWGFLNVNVLMVAMAFFIHQAGSAEGRAALLERALEGRVVRDLMTPEPATVPPGMPLAQFARLRSFRAHTGYPVVADDGALLGFARVMDAGAEDEDGRGEPHDATVADVMRPAETVAPATPLAEVVPRLSGEGLGRLVVVDSAGRVLGVLSKTDVVRELERWSNGRAGRQRW